MTWVKICGTTNLEDALAAVDAGADALGFVFAPSPRRITPQQAAEITAGLPPSVEKVGVFVNETAERIREILDQVAVTTVQLHGDEDAESIAQLRRSTNAKNSNGAGHITIIKALAVRSAFDRDAAGLAAAGVGRFLLDSAGGGLRGGTGKTFNISEAAEFVRRYRSIVAGGLTSENVGQIIRDYHPWGVDVVSGVEREPGLKNYKKLRAFIECVREADQARVAAKL